jgi:signal transduction histidine kinase
MRKRWRAFGVLAGGVAHDFNNILMAIIANVTLVLDDADSPIASLADNVLIATEQAAHLTNQMLAYSGKGKFTVEPLSLTRQIQEVASLFRLSIAKGVDLRLDLDPSLPTINADASQIQHLVTNLVLNAAEATGSDGVVTISASQQELTAPGQRNLAGDQAPPGTCVMPEVRDTGSGMDESHSGQDFRSLLYNQVYRPWPRPGGRSRDRAGTQWRNLRFQPTGEGDNIPGDLSRRD